MENTVESRKSWRKALKHRLRTRRKTSKEIPTIPITDLDSSEIPHHFNLTHCLPTEFELSPRETEMVSLPAHLSKFDRYESVL
jgi:hypothetical protein